MEKEMVSAGDLEKYAYCPLSWWLNKMGYQTNSNSSKVGIEQHREIAERMDEIRKKERRANTYERYVPIFAIGASVIAVISITFDLKWRGDIWTNIFIILSLIWLLNSSFFLYKAERVSIKSLKPKYETMILASAIGATIISIFAITSLLPSNILLSRILSILSLAWLIGANLFFYISFYLSRECLLKRKEYKIGEEKIEYVDDGKETPPLISKKYGLRGRPDYIIERDGRYIPVEVKTGNTPKHPFFSHIVQVGVYCLLVMEEYGDCPYGVIKYGKKEFEVKLDQRLKDTIGEIKEKLLEDLEKGTTHRNHNRKGKCMNCSRRENCPESLI
jgi:CRISPR-associated exonuclease Cas4